MDKESIIEELIQTISTYHSWGWSPATSTNYSFVDETSKIWVTISGIDKSRITKKDFISYVCHSRLLKRSCHSVMRRQKRWIDPANE